MGNDTHAGQTNRGPFLVGDPDDASARTFCRWIKAAGWEPFVADALDLDLLAKLGDGCSGAIISLQEPDDLDWKIIRVCRAALPAGSLAVVGDRDAEDVVRDQAVGVHFIRRPASFANVFGFADGVGVAPNGRPDPDDTAGGFGKQLGFTRREAEVLVVGAETPDHKDICARLRITDNTLRTYVKRILARARDRGVRAGSLKELVALLRTGAGSRRPTTTGSASST